MPNESIAGEIFTGFTGRNVNLRDVVASMNDGCFTNNNAANAQIERICTFIKIWIRG